MRETGQNREIGGVFVPTIRYILRKHRERISGS
jgi:hypothetical protein